MVGDNPQTDIAGANGAGERWSSVLVRTGVFGANARTPPTNDPHHPADLVVGDVLDAVHAFVR